VVQAVALRRAMTPEGADPAINLDSLSTDARELEEASAVFSRLACYADHKARAMRLRGAGDIPAAQSFERAAQAQYDKLPGWAKW